MADKRKSRYSWKTPWAFNSFHRMRRTLTERYVYKKLGITEKHSTWKKPYYGRSPHKLGEWDFSFPGLYPPGGGGKGKKPGGGGIGMGCNGHILTCTGDTRCAEPTCIGAQGAISVAIVDDPTGAGYVDGTAVCLDSSVEIVGTNWITVLITDDAGNKSQAVYTVPTDCECCEDFTLTGAGTQNPDSTWTGTIDPPCPEATAKAVSNSGGACNFSANVSGDGSQVTVVLGTDDCGTFVVTVTFGSGDCEEFTASFGVRINDLGAPQNPGYWNRVIGTPVPVSDVDCDTCHQCGAGTNTTSIPACIEATSGYRYGTGATCSGSLDAQCWGEEVPDGCSGGSDNVPAPCMVAEGGLSCTEEYGALGIACEIGGHSHNCPCSNWSYSECEWECNGC